MKRILTIFFVLLFSKSFAQADSLLQRLIDSEKNKTQTIQPPKKDIAKQKINTIPVAKDSNLILSSNANDSLKVADSSANALRDSLVQDSLKKAAVVVARPLSRKEDTAFQKLLSIPYNQKKIQPVLKSGDPHLIHENDFLFYLLIGLVLFVAVIKQLFPKYFGSLFSLLFAASFRQKQRREQLMQQALPSLLMNIVFILVGGTFIALLANNYHWLNISFWWLALYSITILALVYIFKYIVIQFTGWVFNAIESASTYSFIVFLINKVIGILLLPLLLLLAFSQGQTWNVIVTLSACLVILLLIFRYIISLNIIRGTLNISAIHFFIYLCAIEIMPILIIYKVLFNYVGKSN